MYLRTLPTAYLPTLAKVCTYLPRSTIVRVRAAQWLVGPWSVGLQLAVGYGRFIIRFLRDEEILSKITGTRWRAQRFVAVASLLLYSGFQNTLLRNLKRLLVT